MIQLNKLALLTLMPMLLTPVLSQARLGEAESSVAATQRSLGAGKVKVRLRAGYKVHEVAAEGRTVTEYSANGTVFAVAWHGQLRPNLKDIFGSYYKDYDQKRAETPQLRGRQPVQVETNDVIVVQGGHPRDFRGYAYVKSLMPKDFRLEDLK